MTEDIGIIRFEYGGLEISKLLNLNMDDRGDIKIVKFKYG